MNKKLLYILIISFSLISLSVYADPTEYDEEQDDAIENNIDAIEDNADNIADIADNFTDNAENIDTNVNDISTNTSNIEVNENNIDSNTDNISNNINNISTNTDDIFINTDDISGNKTSINRNSQRLDNHEGRIGELEETEICIRSEMQFIREKNLTVGIYGKTDFRHPQINNEIGLNIVIGLGKSWTEKEMDKIQAKLNKLEKMIEKGIKHKAGKNDKL